MIINIRGTSGSGKSTIVRKFLSDYGNHAVIKDDKVIGHRIMTPSGRIHVIGPYLTPTGGCDRIKEIKDVFDAVLKRHESGAHVIFEGLLVSRSKGRIIDLWRALNQQDLQLYHLTTSLEDCFKAIQERRAIKGNTKPLNPQRTRENYDRALKISDSLKELGMPVFYVSREEAYPTIKRILGLI